MITLLLHDDDGRCIKRENERLRMRIDAVIRYHHEQATANRWFSGTDPAEVLPPAEERTHGMFVNFRRGLPSYASIVNFHGNGTICKDEL